MSSALKLNRLYCVGTGLIRNTLYKSDYLHSAPKSSKTWNGSKTLPALKFVDATMESVLFGSIVSYFYFFVNLNH